MNETQRRKVFQRVKAMTTERFWSWQNWLHTRAYDLSGSHHLEAIRGHPMGGEQMAREIAEMVDSVRGRTGLKTITIDDTEDVEFQIVMGGRTVGTPIPNRANEEKSIAAGPVTTYKLPPEELEKLRAGTQPTERRPIHTSPDGGRSERNRLIENQTKNEVDDMKPKKTGPDCGLTKRIFLEQIAAGETVSSIERAWKMKNQTLPYLVKVWGLRGVTAGKARELLAEMPTMATDELESLQPEAMTEDVVPAQPQPPGMNATASFYAEVSADRQAKQSDADPFASVEWFNVEQVLDGPSVSLNSRGLSFDEEATKRMGLKANETLMIGAAPGKLVFQKGARGLKLREVGGSTVRIESKRIGNWQPFKVAAKKRYPLKQDAMRGVYYIEVEETDYEETRTS